MSEDWVGKTLSKVIIERKLSRGGMAEVYLGRHTTLDRPVAVKILHGYLADDEALRERTQQEARAIASLRHPNIVQVFDFDVAAGRPYIVMELLDGISLADYLNAQHQAGFSLPLPRITHILNQLGSALDYAHQHGIIHRDIKPSNVMLRRGQTPLQLDLPLPEDAQAVLTDFGIARLTHATSHTASGSVLGTPFYMSPEQIEGGEIDPRTDIYALGIMAYEMLAGTRPFGSDVDTPASILYKHVHDAPPPIPNTDPAVQDVVFKAIAKEREKRFRSAGGFAQAFQAAVHTPDPNQAASARTLVNDATNWSPRDLLRPALAGLAVLALAAAAYFGITTFFPRGATGTPEPQLTRGVQASLSSTATGNETGSGAGATPSSSVVSTFELTGGVFILDNRLTFRAVRIEPLPTGPVLVQARSTEGETAELGSLNVDSSPLTVELTLPEGAALLGSFDALLLTFPQGDGETVNEREIVIPIPAEVTNRYKLLLEIAGAGQQDEEILQGLTAQGSHYASHLGFALDAVAAENLAGTRSHSEHVINILSGRTGEFYGDWNGNDLVENPGDDVGLIVYLNLLSDLLEGPLASPDEDMRQAAGILREELEGLMAQADQALTFARQLVLADTIQVIHDLGIDQEIEQLTLDDQLPAVVEAAQRLALAYYLPLE